MQPGMARATLGGGGARWRSGMAGARAAIALDGGVARDMHGRCAGEQAVRDGDRDKSALFCLAMGTK